MLVGLWHSSAVDPLHIVVVDECSQNGFYCTAAAFGEETGVVFVSVQLLVHLVVKWFVDTVFYLFKFRDFATALCSERTFSAIRFTAPVALLLIPLAVG